MKLWHRLKHVFGWNRGQVVTIRLNADENEYWIGFQCTECGNIGSLTKAFGPSWVEAHRELK